MDLPVVALRVLVAAPLPFGRRDPQNAGADTSIFFFVAVSKYQLFVSDVDVKLRLIKYAGSKSISDALTVTKNLRRPIFHQH